LLRCCVAALPLRYCPTGGAPAGCADPPPFCRSPAPQAAAQALPDRPQWEKDREDEANGEGGGKWFFSANLAF
jgi:hypothetical protein